MEITISLFKKPDSDIYHMQYRDPITGNKRRKTTGTNKKREAERLAGKWEKEILAGANWKSGNIFWSDYRERFEDEHLAGLAEKTQKKYSAVLNVFEELINPKKLKAVTTQTISQYQKQLRNMGRSENTIKSHLAHLHKVMTWAHDQELIDKLPKFPKVQRAKKSRVMKGRPLNVEEFERMIMAVEKVIVEPNKGKAKKRRERKPDFKRIPSWKNLIRGLWLSGLRIGEAMNLHWADQSKICVKVDGPGSMFFLIPAEEEKGFEDRELAIAPEFVEFLEAIPAVDRRGFVFNPIGQNKDHGRLDIQTVGRTIGKIGEQARIKVNTKKVVNEDGAKSTAPVYAGSHDLRRSFGQRWATKVMPVVLMELMRHKSIETTMKYYVGRNARKTSDLLREIHQNGTSMQAMGSVLGSSQENAGPHRHETPQK